MTPATDTRTGVLPPVAALRLLRQVLSDTSMGKSARIALAAIILNAKNETGMAWGGYRGVAGTYGLSTSSVREGLKRGPEHGVTPAGRGDKGAIRYRVRPLRVPEDSPEERSGERSAQRSAKRSGQRSAQRRAKSSASLSDTILASSTNPLPAVPAEEGNSRQSSATVRPKKKRSQDPIWDAVAAAFRLKPVTESDKSRIGRVVRDLKAKGATRDELVARIGRYQRRWPHVDCTPEAIVKHWDLFAAEATTAHDDNTGRDNGAALEELDRALAGRTAV